MILKIKTLSVSNNGKIKMAIATDGAELKVYGESTITLCNSINFIAKIEHTVPKSKAPVSPINIFAGVMLYFKKATNAPHNANATMDISILPTSKNQIPNTNVINNPRLAESPLMPSIRLNALMITMMVKIEIMMLANSGMA